MEGAREEGDPTRAGAGVDVVARHRGLMGRTALLSGLTAISRVLGYAREAVSALLFGDASTIYDAFITAWRVPNLFRRFLGEGALSTSLQTAITEVDADRGNEAGRRLFLDTLRWASLLLLLLCAAVMGLVLLVGDRMPLTGWQWLGNDPEPVREFTLRLMPYVVLICLSALISGALNVRGHFAAPAWGPVAMNVVWIAALCGIGWEFGWRGEPEGVGERVRHLSMARLLGWGVLASGLVQLAIQMPALKRAGLALWRGERSGAPVPARARREGGGLAVLRASAPLALGAAVYQINVMIDGLMAESLLREGGPTTLYYANRIQQLPLALVAIAATSAVFPALKALGHEGRLERLRSLHDRTHLGICFIALPASVGLWVLAEPVVAVLLQRGAFTADGVERTAAALRMLSLSLLPAGAVGLVSRTFYALGDFKTPVRVSSAMLVVNVGLNALLVAGLGMDVEGLTLATAVTSWANLAILLPVLLRRVPAGEDGGPAGIGGRLLRTALAAAACGLAALAVHGALGCEPRSASALLLAIGAGAMIYALAARVLGLPEWTDLMGRLRRRGQG